MFLPCEIWEIIESYLPNEMYLNFRLVCRTFSKLSIRYHDIYPDVNIREFYDSLLRNIKERLFFPSEGFKICSIEKTSIYFTRYGYTKYIPNISVLKDVFNTFSIKVDYSLFDGNIHLLKDVLYRRRKYIGNPSRGFPASLAEPGNCEPRFYYLKFIQRRIDEIPNTTMCMIPSDYLFWSKALRDQNAFLVWLNTKMLDYFNSGENIFSSYVSVQYAFTKTWFNTIAKVEDLL